MAGYSLFLAPMKSKHSDFRVAYSELELISAWFLTYFEIPALFVEEYRGKLSKIKTQFFKYVLPSNFILIICFILMITFEC